MSWITLYRNGFRELKVPETSEAAGRRCYEAFVAAAREFVPPHGAPEWEKLSAPIREAWMAAAGAANSCPGI
jgi:hypothetical protein